jgi:hypothetical protein
MDKKNNIRTIKRRRRKKRRYMTIERRGEKLKIFMNTKHEVKEEKHEAVPVQAIKLHRESGRLSPLILKFSARLK